MEQVGKIIALKDGLATLEVRRPSACGQSCTACKVACDQNVGLLTLPNTIQGEVGDFVEIKTNSGEVLKYAFMAYGIPLVLFVATILIAYQVAKGAGNRELIALACGVLSFLLSHLILKKVDAKAPIDKEAVMVRKLG